MVEGLRKLTISLYSAAAAFCAQLFRDRPRRWLTGLLGLAFFFSWGGYQDGRQIVVRLSPVIRSLRLSLDQPELKAGDILDPMWDVRIPLAKFIGAFSLASIISFAITALIIEQRLRPEEELLVSLLGRSGIVGIYPSRTKVQITQQPYAGNVREEVALSKKVKILMIAAYEMIGRGRDSLLFEILESANEKEIEVTILDLNTATGAAVGQARVEQLRQRDDAYNSATLASHIESTKTALSKIKHQAGRKGRVELLLTPCHPIFRLVILDKCLFVSAYVNSAHGHESPVYRVAKCSDRELGETFYQAFDAYYQQQRQLSKVAEL